MPLLMARRCLVASMSDLWCEWHACVPPHVHTECSVVGLASPTYAQHLWKQLLETCRGESDQELAVTGSFCTYPLFFFKKDRFPELPISNFGLLKKLSSNTHFFLLQASRSEQFKMFVRHTQCLRHGPAAFLLHHTNTHIHTSTHTHTPTQVSIIFTFLIQIYFQLFLSFKDYHAYLAQCIALRVIDDRFIVPI